jgi:endonuclease-3 related protein
LIRPEWIRAGPDIEGSMPSFGASFPDLLRALDDRYGRLPTPGAELDLFEAVVAVVLDRLTDPKKGLAARSALREEGLLDPQALAEADPSEVVETLRSAGVKLPTRSLAPLWKLARWVVEHKESLDDLADPDHGPSTAQLREELLSLNGIGSATADALLLFAFHRPAYPINSATYRILIRHGWLDPSADGEEARSVVEGPALEDAGTLARLSAWFERLGRDHCRASVIKCERCPLAPFLPEGGPIRPDFY